MPEYSACELDEIRHRQAVNHAVQASGGENEGEWKEIELKANLQRINEYLKNQHWHRTIKVGSRKI